MITDAIFSECKQFRYTLRRIWGEGPRLMVVMLNPSTADEKKNDPTITRVMERAACRGFDGIIVCNLFSYRTTRPIELEYRWARMQEIVGRGNDQAIRETVTECSGALVAWGAHKLAAKRDLAVLEMLYGRYGFLYSLGLTKTGFPRHPLYVPYSQDFQPYKGRFSK